MNKEFCAKKRDVIIAIIAIIAIIIIILPTATTIIYSIPASDDFAAALTVKKGNVLSTSIRTANEMYMTWGGIWSFYFLENLINPLVYFEATSFAVGIELLIIFMIFLITTIVVIDEIFKILFYGHNAARTLVFSTFFLLIFMNIEIYTDVYFWFVGNCYMWGIILNNIVIIFSIRYLNDKRKSINKVFVLSVIGYFACLDYRGAILSGLIYGIILIIKQKNGAIYFRQIVPLIFMILGGVTAVAAPGNYKRQEVIGSDAGVLLSLFNAGWDEWYSLRMAFSKPIVIIACMGLIVLGMFLKFKMNLSFRIFFCVFILAVIVGYLNYFPLALGYGSKDLPSRIMFGFYFQFFLIFSFGMVLLGGQIANMQFGIQKRKMIAFTTGLILAVFVVTGHYRDTPWYNTISYLPNSIYISTGWKNIFSSIKNSEDDDVTITIPAYLLGTILMTPQFVEGSDNYVNYTSAEYFGKKSITIYYDWDDLLIENNGIL